MLTITALLRLRNYLTISSNESVGPQDPRLLLAKDWMDTDPSAESLFKIWNKLDKVNPCVLLLSIFTTNYYDIQRHNASLSMLLNTFCALLSLLSTHHTYHADGLQIVHRLISRSRSSDGHAYLDRLIGYVTGANTQPNLILAILKLWNVMMDFAGGKERRTVMEAFPWDGKVDIPCFESPSLLNADE
jgi:nucleolar pre-ribosomal-associated protein 1